MNNKLRICLMVLLGFAIVPSTGNKSMAVSKCKPYTVNVPLLQVLKDPKVPHAYVTVLQQGEVACISDDQPVGPQRLGFVVTKSADGATPVDVGGWASLLFMTPQALATSEAPTEAEPPAQPSAEDILRFDQPVPYGPSQVRDKSLKELANAIPMFPPLEGLPDSLWQKNCTACHKWDAKTLCEQGRSYLGKAAEVFRHQHPYGGAYKLSLMRWAKTGCN